MAECETCGECLRKKYALRVSTATEARTPTGPVYFCSEDCRAFWRHHRP